MKHFLVQESTSTLPTVITQVSIDEKNAPTPSCFLPMNVYDDVMAEPSNDNNTCQQDQPRKKHKTVETTLEEESLTHLLILEQLISLDEILGQVEAESTQLLRSSTSTAGEGSSTELAQEQGGNMGVFSAQKTVQILVLKTLCGHGRYQWSSRLDIALFLPKKAVSHTMRIRYLLNLFKVCIWLSRAKSAPSDEEKVQRAAVRWKDMKSVERKRDRS